MKRTIYFRADADHTIGYGHFIRSLALADMLRDEFECTIVTKSPTNYQRNQTEGICGLIELPDDESRFELFLEMLSGEEIVVLDNYFYSIDYQRQIKQRAYKLVCIDDFKNKDITCDLLINTSVSEHEQLPLVEAKTKLQGIPWALLRKEFRGEAQRPKDSDLATICFGGADPLNLTIKALQLLLTMKDIKHIAVVVGTNKMPEDYVIDSRVKVYQNISASEIASLLQDSKFCIVSTSGVAIEAIAMGCPTYTGYYTENQIELYHNLVHNGYVYGLGDLRTQAMHIDGIDKPLKRLDFSQLQTNYINAFKSL
jgi:UDP-2,4-diacetamido-2,4,6-trideoxy-beta-L-altropyranose hydrolase